MSHLSEAFYFGENNIFVAKYYKKKVFKEQLNSMKQNFTY